MSESLDQLGDALPRPAFGKHRTRIVCPDCDGELEVVQDETVEVEDRGSKKRHHVVVGASYYCQPCMEYYRWRKRSGLERQLAGIERFTKRIPRSEQDRSEREEW